MKIDDIKRNLRSNPVLENLMNENMTDRQKIIMTFLECAHGGLPPYNDLSIYELSECLGMSMNAIRNELIHLIQTGEIMEHWVVLK